MPKGKQPQMCLCMTGSELDWLMRERNARMNMWLFEQFLSTNTST